MTLPSSSSAGLRWKSTVRFLSDEKTSQVAIVDLATRNFLKVYDEAKRSVDRRVSGLELTNTEDYASLEKLIGVLVAKGYLIDGATEEVRPRYLPLPREAGPGDGARPRRHGAFFDTPKVVYFAITDQCNLTCRTCYAKPRLGSSKYTGDTRGTLEVLDRIAELNARQLILTGGEPLLRSDVFTLIVHAKKLGLATAMTTNGTLIDDQVAQDLAAAGLEDVQVSIDSHVAAKHDAVRGRGSFEKAIAAVRALRSAGFSKDRVIMSSTSTRDGLADVESYFRLADELGATANFSFFQSVGRGTPAMRPSTEQLLQLTRCRLHRYELKCNPCEGNGPRGKSCFDSEVHVAVGCGLGLTTIAVRDNGDVLPCHLFLSSNDHILGNVKSDDLAEAALRFQGGLPSVDDIDECRSCNVRYFCHNGCRGGTYWETGGFANRSAYCDYFKKFWSAVVWNLGHEGEVERVLEALDGHWPGAGTGNALESS